MNSLKHYLQVLQFEISAFIRDNLTINFLDVLLLN
jgi:hypothetical protein